MYSIVLAAALTAGSPQPGFNGFFRDMFHGGHSCQGQGCDGYTGQAMAPSFNCNGCSGCNGCCGGGSGFLGIRDFFRGAFSSGGCCGGGCCGGYASGCCGGGYPMMGCSGGFSMGCTGSYPMGYSMGSSMGCFGMSSYGYDAPMMAGGPMMMGDSSPMMMGSMPMQMAPNIGGQIQWPQQPQMATPPLNAMPGQAPNSNLDVGPMPDSSDSAAIANSCTVVVEMPADARLYVQGQQMTGTGAVRVFRTPALDTAKKRHTYKVRMEIDRGGRTVDREQVVDLQPGRTARVTFTDPNTGGGGSARINVLAPAGTLINVEGKDWHKGSNTIETPALEPGKEYAYTLKLLAPGAKQPVIKEVAFKAGATVTVELPTAEIQTVSVK